MQLADSHCHLDDAQFDGDRDQVFERASEAGVRYMLSIGTGNGPPDLEAAIRIAERHHNVYASVGVHPNDAEKIGPNTFSDLRSALRHPKVVALGEIGLDYHWGVPKQAQEAAFKEQLSIAAELGKPVVIHTRDAWQDTMTVLREGWAGNGIPCIMHCFTGSRKDALECIGLGFYLAFGGVTTFPKALEIREAAAAVPGDRLLIETDAPYLAPVPYRGKRNEPSYIAHTAKTIAKVRDTSEEDLAALTASNFVSVFGIEPFTLSLS